MLYYLCTRKITVVIAQLVRASDCGSEGRGFEPRFPPWKENNGNRFSLFLFFVISINSNSYSYHIYNSFAI